MGHPVTIDSDDVQALLFAASLPRRLKAAMEQHASDPFVPKGPAQEDLIDRVGKQMRQVTRSAEQESIYPVKLTPAQYERLNGFVVRPPWSRAISSGYILCHAPAQRDLRVLGLLEIGSVYELVRWGDSTPTEMDRGQMVGRVTKRGEKALLDYEMSRTLEASPS